MFANVSSACSVSSRERRTRAWASLTANATGMTTSASHGWPIAQRAMTAPRPASAAAAGKSGWSTSRSPMTWSRPRETIRYATASSVSGTRSSGNESSPGVPPPRTNAYPAASAASANAEAWKSARRHGPRTMRASNAAAPATSAPRQGPSTITAAMSTPEATRNTPGPTGARTRPPSGSSSSSAASAAAPSSARAVSGFPTAA